MATTPARSDALENRARILEVAHEAFLADGAASLNSIAKAAGVGAGTLYRHFPTREDLILAVYHSDIAHLVAEVDDVLAEHSPEEAFRFWFRKLARYVRIKHGLGDALNSAAAQSVVNDSYAPVTAAVAQLIDACVAEGTLRGDLDPADVLLLMGFLWRVSPDDAGLAQADRLMETTITGLQARN